MSVFCWLPIHSSLACVHWYSEGSRPLRAKPKGAKSEQLQSCNKTMPDTNAKRMLPMICNLQQTDRLSMLCSERGWRNLVQRVTSTGLLPEQMKKTKSGRVGCGSDRIPSQNERTNVGELYDGPRRPQGHDSMCRPNLGRWISGPSPWPDIGITSRASRRCIQSVVARNRPWVSGPVSDLVWTMRHADAITHSLQVQWQLPVAALINVLAARGHVSAWRAQEARAEESA